MSKTTSAQRVRTMQGARFTDMELGEAAETAYREWVETEQERLSARIHTVLGHKPSSFSITKGRWVVADVDGLPFGLSPQSDDHSRQLCLLVTCPICEETNPYSVQNPSRNADPYAQLGMLLASEADDPRCGPCIDHNRRVA